MVTRVTPVAVGVVVVDTSCGGVGRVMDLHGERVWLRPVGGGREWEAKRPRLKPVPHAAEVSR
ncbi:hypothetical protein STBA_33520 [Streptomyces sp. MP131-18]|nr:hypothetical protein STBA_33520 [Streptomyces sp. MP131-18]